jgi:TRAP transporter TAXI family solute receptor
MQPKTEKKAKLKTRRLWWQIYGPAIVVTIAGFIIAYQFVKPAPPRSFVLATGPEGGAYYRYGERYRTMMAEYGIRVELRPTSGSLENLALLTDPNEDVDVAFVQGGTLPDLPESRLVALASLYYEPLWIFVRQPAPRMLSELRGKSLAVGMPGSGTRQLALMLLRENGVTSKSATLLPLGNSQAAAALLNGSVDAAFFVAGAEAPLVRDLLRREAEGVDLMSLERAPSYTTRHSFLHELVLTEGVFDLAANIPRRDIRMVSPTAQLVAHSEFHPALIGLLLNAGESIYGSGGLFERPGEFPSGRYVQLPLSEESKRYFKNGRPFLHRVLPFWAANLVSRLKIMLLPLITLLIPLARWAPTLYRWRVWWRIGRIYHRMQLVEKGVEDMSDPEEMRRAAAQLRKLEGEAAKLTVPSSYGDSLYGLRLHIQTVHDQLERRADEIEASGAAGTEAVEAGKRGSDDS